MDVESDTDDEELRQTIQKWEDQLKITSVERNKERATAVARERELDKLSNTERRQAKGLGWWKYICPTVQNFTFIQIRSI